MAKTQLDFFGKKSAFSAGRVEYGGAVNGKDRRIGKRKVERPFDRKKPIFITLKASCAKDKLSMRNYNREVEIKALIDREVKTSGAKLHSYSNNGNHLHIFAKFPSRIAFQRFLRTIGALIARLVTGARKGRPFGKFWDALAHSRVVSGKRGYLQVMHYLDKNIFEASYGYLARMAFELGYLTKHHKQGPRGEFYLIDD
jgi:hypothetical protein